MNVLLERIKPFNTVQCILYASLVLLESIDQILALYAGIIIIMPAHYASNYAGIFDGGLHTTYNTIIRSYQYKSRTHITPGPKLTQGFSTPKK